MEKNEFTEMMNLLAAFRHRDVQTFVTMSDHLKLNNKTLEDVRRYKDAWPELRSADIVDPHNEVMCVKCKEPMDVFSVNTVPRNQVGGDYDLQYICHTCGEEVFV